MCGYRGAGARFYSEGLLCEASFERFGIMVTLSVELSGSPPILFLLSLMPLISLKVVSLRDTVEYLLPKAVTYVRYFSSSFSFIAYCSLSNR